MDRSRAALVGEEPEDTEPSRYEVGAGLAHALARRDPRPASQGEIAPSRDRPFDNFPAFIARARGSVIWDVDGNDFVDFLLGYGAVILGHNHPDVQAAALRAMDDVVCQSPFWSPTQVDLVDRLVRVIPGAEMAFLLRTGSDATSCAVRVARLATGRSSIVRAGYNGWHDWSNPFDKGIPETVRSLTQVVAVNDVDALEQAVERAGNDLAAVVTMPYEHEAPDPAALQHAADLARSSGALFVLDEVRSGFRVALGGAQELLGVHADLVCLSKAMANGFSISALTGPAALLSLLKETKVSSTFFANRTEQAAALATLDLLEQTRPFERIARLGTRLMREANALLTERSAPASLVGHPASPFLRVEAGASPDFAVRLAEGCARHGAVIHPNHQWFISAAHSECDIDRLLEAMANSLR